MFIEHVGNHKHALTNHRLGKHLRNTQEVDALLAELEPQALHGWGEVYKAVAGRLKATLTLPGEDPKSWVYPKSRPIYQIQMNPYVKPPTKRVLNMVPEETMCSLALNNITETRRKRNARLGVDDLEHTLEKNRLNRAALDAMWSACDAARPALLRYIDRKNQLLGHETLHPWNVRAPLNLADDPPLTWEQACTDIIDAFNGFDRIWGRLPLEPFRKDGSMRHQGPTVEWVVFLYYNGRY